MKTNAPGRFSCEIYLKAWAVGMREPKGYVMRHIDECWFCRDIVHGGTKEFPLPLAEEAHQNVRRQD